MCEYYGYFTQYCWSHSNCLPSDPRIITLIFVFLKVTRIACRFKELHLFKFPSVLGSDPLVVESPR